MTAPADVVSSFIAAVERKDVDAALDLLTDDVSYENVPIDPVVGREAVGAVLRMFLEPAAEVDWRVLRTVESGSLVVNERVDRFRLANGWVELPVAGFFEVTDDGRISRWRDFFDMATYTNQVAAAT